MARARRLEIVDLLRQRIVRALATGSLCAGDRLASTRDMAYQARSSHRRGSSPKIACGRSG